MATITTVAGVCNLALGMVGQRQLIDDIDEESNEAQACKLYYSTARDECLAAFPWSFATKRAVLALSTETRTGWDLVYVAPTDLLLDGRRFVWDGSRSTPIDLRIPNALELNDADDGYLLLTDEPDAELVYTAQLNTVALWSNAFVKAVAARLAVDLALMLPVKPELSERLEPRARLALAHAAARDGNASTPDADPESESIRVRG